MSTGRLGRPAQYVGLLGAVALAVPLHGLTDAVAAQIQLCIGQTTILVATFLTTEPRLRPQRVAHVKSPATHVSAATAA